MFLRSVIEGQGCIGPACRSKGRPKARPNQVRIALVRDTFRNSQCPAPNVNQHPVNKAACDNKPVDFTVDTPGFAGRTAVIRTFPNESLNGFDFVTSVITKNYLSGWVRVLYRYGCARTLNTTFARAGTHPDAAADDMDYRPMHWPADTRPTARPPPASGPLSHLPGRAGCTARPGSISTTSGAPDGSHPRSARNPMPSQSRGGTTQGCLRPCTSPAAA